MAGGRIRKLPAVHSPKGAESSLSISHTTKDNRKKKRKGGTKRMKLGSKENTDRRATPNEPNQGLFQNIPQPRGGPLNDCSEISKFATYLLFFPLTNGSIFIMLLIVMTAFCMRGQWSCVHFLPKSLDGEKQHLEPVQRRLRTISSLTDQQPSDPCVAQRSWTLSLMRDWMGSRGPLPCGGTECILPMRESGLRISWPKGGLSSVSSCLSGEGSAAPAAPAVGTRDYLTGSGHRAVK